MLIDRGYNLDCLALSIFAGSALLARLLCMHTIEIFLPCLVPITSNMSPKLEDVSFEPDASSLVCFLHNS